MDVWIVAEGASMQNFESSLAFAIYFGCASLLVGVQVQEVDAAEAQLSADEQTMKLLTEAAAKGSEGAGLVFVGTVIIKGKNKCLGTEVSVGQIVEGKYRAASLPIQGMYKVFGTPKSYGPKGLRAGQYVVGWVKCQNVVGSVVGGTTFNGPYARFQVKAGEVVDVGALKLEYESENIFAGSGKIRLSIEPTSQERLVETRKQTPTVMSKLVTRHMVLAGATERQVKRPGL